MRKLFLSAATAFGLIAGSAAADEPSMIGVVNFVSCITDSKLGKKEQENMENIRKQLSSLIEDTEKELRELAAKFEDTEYLDSLSPKAEEELKLKFQTLQEDLSRYQNQFYQVLNHANNQMMHKMNSNISKAAEKIAKEKKLDYVMNKEACFFIRSDLDVTQQVIVEMDKSFDLDAAQAKKVSESEEIVPLQALDDSVLKQAG